MYNKGKTGRGGGGGGVRVRRVHTPGDRSIVPS